MSYCTACGQPRGGPAPFCTRCGAPLAGPPQGRPEPGEPGAAAGTDDFFDSLFRPDPPPAEPDQTRQIPVPPGAGPDRIEPRPPRRGQRAASRRIVMAAGVFVLLAAAGTGAWLVFRHPHASGPAGAASGTPAGQASLSPATPTAAPASSPRASAGEGLVTAAPGVSRQAPEPRVIAYLNDYFAAINRHSYRRFAVLLGPQMRRTLPAAAFYAGYRTTSDSAATLTRLSPAGGGHIRAGVAFTSHQAASDSPSRSGCTRWGVVLVLAAPHGKLVLEPPPPGYRASYRAC